MFRQEFQHKDIMFFGDSLTRKVEEVLTSYGEEATVYCYPGLCAMGALEQWQLVDADLPASTKAVFVVIATNDMSSGTAAREVVESMKRLIDAIYCRMRAHVYWLAPPPRFQNGMQVEWGTEEELQRELDGSKAAATAELMRTWAYEVDYASVLDFGTELDPTHHPEYYRRQTVPRDEVHLSALGLDEWWGLALRAMTRMRRMYGFGGAAIGVWLETAPDPRPYRRRYHLINGQEKNSSNKRLRR